MPFLLSLIVVFFSTEFWSSEAYAQDSEKVLVKDRVSIVQMPFIVASEDRKSVVGLKKSDFEFVDAGMVIDPAYFFEAGTSPFNLLVVMDVSGSMEQRGIDITRQAVLGFISRLRPRDQVAVVAFADESVPLVDFTSDRDLLKKQVLDPKFSAVGGSAIWRSTYNAIDQLFRGHEGQQNIVVFISDAMDNENPDGSQFNERPKTLKEVRKLCTSRNVSFHSIHLSGVARGGLKEIAKATSGSYTSVVDLGSASPEVTRALEGAFSQVLVTIQASYSVGFYPRKPGALDWQKFEIRPKNPKLKVSSRGGYCLSEACSPDPDVHQVPKDFDTAVAFHREYLVPVELRGTPVRLVQDLALPAEPVAYEQTPGQKDHPPIWQHAAKAPMSAAHIVARGVLDRRAITQLQWARDMRGLQILDISARVRSPFRREENSQYWMTEVVFLIGSPQSSEQLSLACRFPAQVLTEESADRCLQMLSAFIKKETANDVNQIK